MARNKKEPISPKLKRKVFSRDNYTCRYCGSTQGPLHCDHVYPESRGGETTYNNLVTACQRCNLSKHTKVGIWPLPINSVTAIDRLTQENIRLAAEKEEIDKLTKESAKKIDDMKNEKRQLMLDYEKQQSRMSKESYQIRRDAYSYLISAASIPCILGMSYVLFSGNHDITALSLLLSSVALFLISYIYRRTNFGD